MGSCLASLAENLVQRVLALGGGVEKLWRDTPLHTLFPCTWCTMSRFRHLYFFAAPALYYDTSYSRLVRGWRLNT